MNQQPSHTTDTPFTAAEEPTPTGAAQAPDLLPDPDRNLPVPRQSHIISTMLAPAMRLWLRSQVEAVGELEVLIEGGDRQLLKGIVPRLTITARDVLYQGLYMSQVRLVGRGIQVNFGQVLRGKPLQLARTIPVQIEAVFCEADLNDSLEAPILMTALTEMLVHLLRAGVAPELVDPNSNRPIILDNLKALLHPGKLTLGAELVSAAQGTTTPFAVRTGLRLAGRDQIRLESPEWLPTFRSKRGLPLDDLDGYPLDLGSEVKIQSLSVDGDRLLFRGSLNVYADDGL